MSKSRQPPNIKKIGGADPNLFTSGVDPNVIQVLLADGWHQVIAQSYTYYGYNGIPDHFTFLEAVASGGVTVRGPLTSVLATKEGAGPGL